MTVTLTRRPEPRLSHASCHDSDPHASAHDTAAASALSPEVALFKAFDELERRWPLLGVCARHPLHNRAQLARGNCPSKHRAARGRWRPVTREAGLLVKLAEGAARTVDVYLYACMDVCVVQVCVCMYSSQEGAARTVDVYLYAWMDGCVV